MNNPIIVFTSKYGSTRRYATALGQRLGTRAPELGRRPSAPDTEPLIVLAPVYATRILGRRRVIRAIRSAPGRVALVVVAMSPPGDSGRGTLDRILMAALRRELRKTPDDPAAEMLLPGQRLEFVDESTLDPVVNWATR